METENRENFSLDCMMTASACDVSRRNFPFSCPNLHLFSCDGEVKLQNERERERD